MRMLLGMSGLAVVALVIGLLVQMREAPPAAAAHAPAAAPAATVVARLRPIELGQVDDDGADEGWAYDAVTSEEQAVIDRGRDVAGWEDVHRGFSEAAHEGVGVVP